MATYRVAFDDKWQGDFEDVDEAFEWARAVGETGRMAYVAAFRGPVMRLVARPELIAVFPENRAEEGKELWKTRSDGGGGGGIQGVPF